MKIKRYTSLFLITCIMVLSAPLYSQSTYVPLGHRVYDYLERMETKQIIANALIATKPLTRADVAACLDQVLEAQKADDCLNKVEAEQLAYLCIEFREELNLSPDQETRIDRLMRKIKVLPRFVYANGVNLYSIEEDQFRVYIDPVLRHRRYYNSTDSLKETEQIHRFSNGGRMYGQIANRLGFFVDARDNKEWGTRTYAIGNYTLPGSGFVRATSPEFIYYDETEAYLKLGLGYVDLVYGKFENEWGPGHSGSLMLSDGATTYDQFKMDVRYKNIRFTSIYAYLIDYREFRGDSLQQRKYMAAHRLEIAPWRWLKLGLSESVIFRGRSFEPSYINPLMFLRSAEHYLGSPDNMMMGMDLVLLPMKNVKCYGELLIDDIATSKLGSGWYGNKLGFLGGLYITEPFRATNVDVRLEYVRLKPYLYSHENNIAYTHYATSMGHPIGPNSDLLALSLDYQPAMRWNIRLSYHHQRHGANSDDVNYGGDVHRHFGFGDDETVDFLGGLRETKNTFGVDMSWEFMMHMFLRAGFAYGEGEYETLEKGDINRTAFYVSLGMN